MYQIVEKFQEPTGRWCVRVVLSETEAQFFWFATEPTQGRVDLEVQCFLLNRQADQSREQAERIRQEYLQTLMA